MHQDIQTVGVRIADAAAAGCIGTAAVINMADINVIVQIAAGVVAIIAGLAAAGFHIYKTYDLHARRKMTSEYIKHREQEEYPGD
jgi:hypothetical protein